jgi:hypothetical protein
VLSPPTPARSTQPNHLRLFGWDDRVAVVVSGPDRAKLLQ